MFVLCWLFKYFSPLGISVTSLGVVAEIMLVFGERRNGVWDKPEMNL